MKNFFFITAFFVFLLFATTTYADQLVIMTNGMTCWRNAYGQVWGCSGGRATHDPGFNDTRTGERYQYINPHQAVGGTGQVINAPNRRKLNPENDDD